ncbi:MAG: sulfotransferase family 2 domain-containing protein [Planctomycetota bacterium]
MRNLIRKPHALREVRRRVGLRLATLGRDKKGIPAFVHVRKTGGTYLARFNADGDPVLSPLEYFGHSIVGSPDGVYKDMVTQGIMFVPKDRVRRYFVFSVCRNPFDLLVSYKGYASRRDPETYRPDSYDYEAAQGDFGDFVKRLADREFPWPTRRLLHYQMFADDGEFVVDWVMRNESLDDDAEALAGHLGIGYRRLERTNQGSHRPKDYREMYTDSLVDLVQRTWGDDLALYGYDFESGPVAGEGLHRLIGDERRRAIRYDWESGSVSVDGRPLGERGE